MSSDIKPNQIHSVITLQLAIHSQDGDFVADGINELLRPEIGEGFIADFTFFNTDDPILVKASNDPEEGELFIIPETTLYPDMDKQALALVLEYHELDDISDMSQEVVDGVDHQVAEVASNLTHNTELPSAIALLEKSHPNIAIMLKAVADSALMRDCIQQNAHE
jgi:hypothetical protein